MLKVFFENLPSYLANPCYEPVKADRLDGYLDSNTTRTRASAIKKAQEAAQLSKAALSWAESDPKESIRIWKLLLGEFFPSYG
jgi:hypothetical protein